MSTTPNADIKLVYGLDANGYLTVDFAQTPSGDIALVTGAAKLQQDIIRWLLTPEGDNPLDPTYGNPLFALLGQPGSNDLSVITAMVEAAETNFIARQQAAAADGYLTLDEQVDHFENLQVFSGGSTTPTGVQLPVGTLQISLTIISRAGSATDTAVPFSLSLIA